MIGIIWDKLPQFKAVNTVLGNLKTALAGTCYVRRFSGLAQAGCPEDFLSRLEIDCRSHHPAPRRQGGTTTAVADDFKVRYSKCAYCTFIQSSRSVEHSEHHHGHVSDCVFAAAISFAVGLHCACCGPPQEPRMNLLREGVPLAPMSLLLDTQPSPRCDAFEAPRTSRRLPSLGDGAANRRGTNESSKSPGVRGHDAVPSRGSRNRCTATEGRQT